MKRNLYRVLVAAALLTGINSMANAQIRGLINRGKQAVKNEATKEAKKQAKEQGMNALTKVTGKESSFSSNGHDYTQKGTLSIKAYNPAATGMVTFTNVPSNYEEFEEVYTEFLGKTPYGTAAMMPMAMALMNLLSEKSQKITGRVLYTICTQW